MAHRSIMVVIPPEMSDSDECYVEVIGYVAACTGFGCIHNDQGDGDDISCDAYFKDDKGNVWHGQLREPPYPDGSRKYIVDLAEEAGGI